jgi:tRNA(His) 5'-end guanylyltransferase
MNDSQDLPEIVEQISALIKERKPSALADVPFEVHPLPPFIRKSDWTVLGDAIKLAERPACYQIPGNKWISLRCDGNSFGQVIKRLVKQGIFLKGYSEDFETIMRDCCRALMERTDAKCGFTHSDELTVLIEPKAIIRDEQQPHFHNGRVQKLCSLAAATVTARFIHFMMMLFKERDLDFPVENLPTFDCRVGVYDTKQEALSLLFWRSYDCSTNSVSDAVHKCDIDGSKDMLKNGTVAKLKWLHSNSLLPLPRHQREGSYFVKKKSLVERPNGKIWNGHKYCLRSRIHVIEGNILDLFREGRLTPSDDILPEDSSSPKIGNVDE